MQLSDILSAKNVASIYEATSNVKSYAEMYAPSASEHTAQAINKFAANLSCKLDEKFWKSFEIDYAYGRNVMICVSGKRANVMDVMENVTFAKHICQLLKAGNSICWVRDSRVYAVTWDNWKSLYAKMTVKRDSCSLPTPPSSWELLDHEIKRKRDKMFYESAEVIRSKKLSKRGYNMTFDEVRAMRRHDEYEKYLRSTSKEARKILSVL